ncbi:hypothetical protein [Paraburkholderia sp.]|uniref:hypothetical protein n=1 Tax=Paraburkholderia sp. TaxID=1926495 RepID=UPI002393557D|nr:hypothetical protein [Paraburkholderia sp.]MDE1179483.1 hypothetical protein [Paraburkholderia sp.]
MIDIDKLETLAKNVSSIGRPVAVNPAEILEMIAEVRRLRALLNNRPALNSGLVEAYHLWTAGVYASEAASASGETKQ